MLENLKEEVYHANIELVKKGLVILTWGNVSGIDSNREFVAIKPSGVEYDKLTPDDIVIVNMRGEVVDGKLNPSSDTPTHLILYREYVKLGGICHTHSVNATAFAQAKNLLNTGIVPMGTTHADYFDGAVPVTREMKKPEIEDEYEKNTGLVIVETFTKHKLTPQTMPAVLVCSHGPFTFGKDAAESVYHAEVLETVAEMAIKTGIIAAARTSGVIPIMQKELLRKHFDRKHGEKAYYGQKKY